MLKHSPEDAFAKAKMLYYQSKRKKKPTIIVEGDYDLRVFQGIMNTRIVNIDSYQWPSNDNKGDLIKIVKKLETLEREKKSPNWVVGVVDADCDLIIDKLYESNFIPYAENIFDTSPSTDLNLLLTSRLSLEKYLLTENLCTGDFSDVYNLLAWFSALRTLKKRFEDVKEKTVYIHFSDIKKNLCEKRKDVPRNIEEFVKMFEVFSREKIRGYSNSYTKKFFDFIRNNNRLEKVLSGFNSGDVKFFQYVNGHDLSFTVEFLGRKRRRSQIEEMLINPDNLDYLKETKLFTQLREWGNQHSIKLF